MKIGVTKDEFITVPEKDWAATADHKHLLHDINLSVNYQFECIYNLKVYSRVSSWK